MQDAIEHDSPETAPEPAAPPVDAAPPADDPIARLLVESPLNDATLVEQAFGGLAPEPAHVHATYLDRPLAERPRLSLLFDPAYYLEQNPDVAAAGIDPYVHFLASGMEEGRSPHPLVELAFLRAQVQRDCPFWTVAVLGDALRTAEYRPHPLFDPALYLAANDDVREAGVPALEHFLRSGADEGRRPNRFFDVAAYQAAYDDVPADGYGAFLHFLRRGDLEGRSPGQGFDGQAYRRFHPELEGTWIGSLAHHLREHRDATPDVTVPAAVAEPAPEHLPEAEAEPDIASGPEPEDARADRFLGSFDAIEDGVAVGWAFNPLAPSERLLVEVVADGQVVGRDRADGMRADLREQGIGDGAYHFAIRIAQDIADGAPHTLQARVAGAEGATLHGSHDYRAEAEIPTFDRLSLAQTDRLAHELASATEAAVDPVRIGEASLLLATGRLSEAVDALRALAAEWPDDPLVHLKLAEADLLRGRLDEAAAAYAVAGRVEATAGWACLGLGNVRRLLGDWRGAEECYVRGCAAAPGLAPLQARLEALRSRSLLSEIRSMVAAGDADGARGLIVAELVAAPEDPEVRDLAVKLLVPDSRGLDPALAEANRSLVLLEAVMAHVLSRRERA